MASVLYTVCKMQAGGHDEVSRAREVKRDVRRRLYMMAGTEQLGWVVVS